MTDKTSLWEPEDITRWLDTHMGEYLIKRVEIKHRISEGHFDGPLAEAAEELKKDADRYGADKDWLCEAYAALVTALAEEKRCPCIVAAGIDDIARVVIDAEPKAQELIAKISQLGTGEN